MARDDIKNIDNLQTYFKAIKNSKGLTREQEAELGKRIKSGDKSAVTELVEANLQFVVRTAKQYVNSGVPLDDLISEGNFGLYRAAEKFDYTKGKKFITYAVWWIKSYIQDAIKQYKGCSDEVSLEDYMKYGDYGEETYQESAEIVNNEYEQKLTDIQSRGMAVDELMGCLQERENKILCLYFGLHGKKQMNLKEISEEMNISSERVRQIVNTSITKLKANVLGGEHFEEFRDLY